MGNRKYRKLKKHEHEQVINAYNELKNYSKVGKMFGIYHTSVMYIIKKAGYYLKKEKTYTPRELIDTKWYQKMAREDIKKRKEQMKIGLQKLHEQDEKFKSLPKRIIEI